MELPKTTETKRTAEDLRREDEAFITVSGQVDIRKQSLIARTPAGGYRNELMNGSTLGKYPGLTVLFGAPSGIGKTAFTQLEIAQSINDGKRVALCLTESEPSDFLRYVRPFINFDDKENDEAYLDYMAERVIIYTNIAATPKFMYWAKAHKYQELYIDYLDATVNFSGDAYEKSEAMATMVRKVNDAAIELGLFVWITAQYKGGVDVAGDGYNFRKSSELMCPVKQCYVLQREKGALTPDYADITYKLTIAKNSFRVDGAKLFTDDIIYLNDKYQQVAYVHDGETIRLPIF